MKFWKEWREKDMVDRAKHLEKIAKMIRNHVLIMEDNELSDEQKIELLSRLLNGYFEDLDQTERDD